MPRARRDHPNPAEIRRAARATVSALATLGVECCLFGSAACALYGATRVPNDVDVIVLNPPRSWTEEDIKQYIVREDDDFFLVASVNPRNIYQVLWYSLPARRSCGECKVDILFPGTLDIPQIPTSLITYPTIDKDIPAVPYVLLILLKLRGWDDHRNHHRQDMIKKQYVDVEDIEELLQRIGDEDRLRKERWLPKGFLRRSRKRVLQFIEEYPDTADYWRTVGFHV